MDRRAKAKQAQRKAAKRRKEKERKAAAALAYGDAWATVTFTAGAGYLIGDIYDTKDEAEEAARLGTQQAMDDAKYLARDAGSGYSVVFAAPVEKADQAPKYKRGVPYYAALRAATGGFAHARAVFLFASEEEVAAAAQLTADAGPEKALTAIGGPVLLDVAKQ